MMLLTIRGTDTTHAGHPVAVHAPVDGNLKVRSAILVDGPTGVFGLWQAVDWYFVVDPIASAVFQRQGANLASATILLLLAV